MDQLSLNLDTSEETIVEHYISEIKSILSLSKRRYDLDQIQIENRTPEKGDAYQAITICSTTCCYVKGKNSQSLYINPKFCEFLQEKGWNFDNGKGRWPRLPVSSFSGFLGLSSELESFYEECLYSSSGRFACCADYEKCSDERECVKSDIMFSGKCGYRQNLKMNNIFYGKNRNNY